MATNRNKPKWRNYGGCINISKDLKIADIPRLAEEPDIHAIQFFTFEDPSKKTWHVLNSFFEKHPEIDLSIQWRKETKWDFLRYLPAVKSLSLSSYFTKCFSTITQYVDLKRLCIGETKSIATDISFIQEFPKLEILSVDGMKKGLNAVAQLENLRAIRLRGVKLKNLDFLSTLNRLRLLSLRFGSYQDLTSLGQLCDLEYLEISRTRKFPDYDFLKGMKNLQFLDFEGLSQLEKLPDFSGQSKLQKIRLDNLSKLCDVRSMSHLANLKEFWLGFPEKFNATQREVIFVQAFEIAEKLSSLEMTNLFFGDKKNRSAVLEKRGVKPWDYRLSKWNQDRIGEWTL